MQRSCAWAQGDIPLSTPGSSLLEPARCISKVEYIRTSLEAKTGETESKVSLL